MSGYITWGDLIWVILALVIGDILGHVISDLVKLAWQRRRESHRP